ncbi:ATP-binding protein [Dactylosporangium salmoneum]|uniref:Orc1-like AAA ATPase domain-containing protein n=1 Tax=Dactylosporangium salmoneum TaxID=53361 RepID=A0ABP5UU92_9ACTN
MRTEADLARLLRGLRRREARRRAGTELTYREIAAAAGWSHGIVGEYLGGRVLPPTGRFDDLVRMLGASPAEQGALATARDRVEEQRRRPAPPGASGAREQRRAPAPRQLPLDVGWFTGRTAQLAALDALLVPAGDRTAPRFALVTGPPGVGKTALAVHWGHRAAAQFPAGQLYADLCGFAPGPPVDPADVLAAFLRALGEPVAAIGAGLAERSAQFRSRVADRPVLIVLDNAATADQVRPLLPGTRSCAALVTSRDALDGLVAREGARRVRLAPLDRADSVALVRRVAAGRPVPDADALAGRCGGLPLALRIAVECGPGAWEESAGDLFSWSVRRLGPAAARAFGLLGRHPGRSFDAGALAALAGTPAATARAALRELARAHLVEPLDDDWYGMHDLVRAYAASRADAAAAPLARLADHYVRTASAAVRTMYPHDSALPRGPVAPHGPALAGGPALPGGPALASGPACSYGSAAGSGPPPPGPDAALAWLDRERPALVAVATGGLRSVDLSRILWRYLEVGAHYRDALAVHAAAAADGDDPEVLSHLGAAHWWLGRPDEARAWFDRSLAGYRLAGDPRGEARARARLALVHERLGDYPSSAAALRAALALYRALGDRHGEGAQLLNLGIVQRRRGRLARAAAHHRRAAALFEGLGDARLHGYALGNLGAVESLAGRHERAVAHLRRSLEHCLAAGDRGGEGSARCALGAALRRSGRAAQSIPYLRQALYIGRDTAELALEVEARNALGDALHALGRPDAAWRSYAAALALAERVGDRYEQACALHGQSAVAGDPLLRRRAAALFVRLGVPNPARLGRPTGPGSARGAVRG